MSIIPHTQTVTTLTQKSVGAEVNLEVDLIGKYVEKLVAPFAPTRTSTAAPDDESLRRLLKENGYDRT